MPMVNPIFQTSGISIWFWLGLVNVLAGKLVLFYCLRHRINSGSTTLLLLFVSTVGGAIGSLLAPSIMTVILGATAGLFLGSAILGINEPVGDLFALFLSVCLGIGRIGCIVSGCCFGSPTDLPWGITYGSGYPAYTLHVLTEQIPPGAKQSLSVHPVPAYEIIFLMFSVVFLLFMRNRTKDKNRMGILFIAAYFLFRFGIEFIRDTTNLWWSHLLPGPITLFQWLLVVIAIILVLWRKPLWVGIYSFSPSLLFFFFVLVAIVLRHQFLFFHTVQILIILSLFMGSWWIENRPHAITEPIPATALLLIIIIIPRLYAQISKSNPFPRRNVQVYLVDHTRNTLVRIGDQNMSFDDFHRRKNILTQGKITATVDSMHYAEIKKGIHYYGAVGGGHSHRQKQECGGETIIYDHRYLGVLAGMEQKTQTKKHVNYTGVNFIYTQDSFTRTNVDKKWRRESKQRLMAATAYDNINYKWVGLGIGIAATTGLSDTNQVYLIPTGYLRLGPPVFFVESGFMDRFDLRPEPLRFRVGLGWRLKENLVFGAGVTNFGDLAGYFFRFQNGNNHYKPSLTLMKVSSGLGLSISIEPSPKKAQQSYQH